MSYHIKKNPLGGYDIQQSVRIGCGIFSYTQWFFVAWRGNFRDVFNLVRILETNSFFKIDYEPTP